MSLGRFPSSRSLTPHNQIVFARGAALVCHVDIAFIMFPICRNFISMLRRTPLNDIIP